MTTRELSAETGISPKTIRKFAKDLGGICVGGSQGWVFKKKAIKQLELLVEDRASKWRTKK